MLFLAPPLRGWLQTVHFSPLDDPRTASLRDDNLLGTPQSPPGALPGGLRKSFFLPGALHAALRASFFRLPSITTHLSDAFVILITVTQTTYGSAHQGGALLNYYSIYPGNPSVRLFCFIGSQVQRFRWAKPFVSRDEGFRPSAE